MRRLKKAAGALNTAGVDTVQQKPISRLTPLQLDQDFYIASLNLLDKNTFSIFCNFKQRPKTVEENLYAPLFKIDCL